MTPTETITAAGWELHVQTHGVRIARGDEAYRFPTLEQAAEYVRRQQEAPCP